jgi:hypothetical protein
MKRLKICNHREKKCYLSKSSSQNKDLKRSKILKKLNYKRKREKKEKWNNKKSVMIKEDKEMSFLIIWKDKRKSKL